MRWNTLMIGIGIGLLGSGYLLLTKDKKAIPVEKALRIAKNAFSEKGNIEGSWIHMVPETIEKNQLLFHVYRGGITRKTSNETERFEFLIDQHTGTIIETSSLS